MAKLFGTVKRYFKRQDEGATLVEYAQLVALVAFACVAAMSLLGTDLQQFFTAASAALKNA
jgi:Flp pilus assembly pilin Flp